MWFEYLNSAACAALLLCMVPVAHLTDPRRHPGHVLMLLAIEFVFFLQIVAPWVPELPQVVWHTALMHTLQAGAVVVLRKRIWLVVRTELGRTLDGHPLRRAEDVRRMGAV